MKSKSRIFIVHDDSIEPQHAITLNCRLQKHAVAVHTLSLITYNNKLAS